MFMQQGVDAFIFLDAHRRDVQGGLQVASEPAVRDHHLVARRLLSESEGLHMFKRTPARGVFRWWAIDQWAGMASVMRLIRKHGHRNVLFFAGPGQWRDASTRLMAWNKLCAQKHREFGDGAVRR